MTSLSLPSLAANAADPALRSEAGGEPPGLIPAFLWRPAANLAAWALPALLLSQQAFAQAVGNGLGGRMQAASTDLTTGGGYVMTLLGYFFGGAAILAGVYTIWQNQKNPNGQNRLGYGFISVLAGGAFLAASLFGGFSSNTVAGAAPTNTGTAAQMVFQ